MKLETYIVEIQITHRVNSIPPNIMIFEGLDNVINSLKLTFTNMLDEEKRKLDLDRIIERKQIAAALENYQVYSITFINYEFIIKPFILTTDVDLRDHQYDLADLIERLIDVKLDHHTDSYWHKSTRD